LSVTAETVMSSALSWDVTMPQVAPPATIMMAPAIIVIRPMSLTVGLVVGMSAVPFEETKYLRPGGTRPGEPLRVHLSNRLCPARVSVRT